MSDLMQKPMLSFWQIWNMCFGFLGIQFGFALQNANTSRIFQTLGAKIEDIPILWIAAPLTGLIVQPIIGYFSDKTWTRMGRRRPYFFCGAVVTSLALVFMPQSPTLWMAAGLLWILDASINVTMEPFRAFVGDNLGAKQHTFGYAMQSFFIGSGAIVASMLPWILSRWFGISNIAEEGEIPAVVTLSFYIGAATLFLAVMWTVIRSHEYSPEQLQAFTPERSATQNETRYPTFRYTTVIVGLLVGVLLCYLVKRFELEPQLYLLAAGFICYAVMQFVAMHLQRTGRVKSGFYEVCANFNTMPSTMRRLAWVQFFSWFALFAMWIYTTAAVTEFHFGSGDPQSIAYNDGANWVGVLFGVYNGAAALAAMFIAPLSKWMGNKRCHQLNLTIGAVSLALFLVIKNPTWLLLPMVGVGFAWCSILSMPYAILAGVINPKKMGTYMGIFNFFIVIPQLLAATVLGLIVKYFFDGVAIYALLVAAFSWLLAAITAESVNENATTEPVNLAFSAPGEK